jgi:hypothetical protein
MAARNRVTPTGDIVAIPLRGAWLGNRGILHRDREVVRFHASALWIICALSFKDWRLPQWRPHHFTVLFFHDEAVALAAGRRPRRTSGRCCPRRISTSSCTASESFGAPTAAGCIRRRGRRFPPGRSS